MNDDQFTQMLQRSIRRMKNGEPEPPIRFQCKACPWRKDVVPERDIPGGYCEAKHLKLKGTIATEASLDFSGELRVMACHESPVGRELPCLGWVSNQLGEGNNIALRLAVATGRLKLPPFRLVGPQHERFEDTLPKARMADVLCRCGHPFGEHDFEECVGRVCKHDCTCTDFKERKKRGPTRKPT